MNQEINEASVAEAQQKLIAALLGDDDDEDDIQPTGETPDGHLLLEIIRQEEERELQYMVKRIRGLCRQQLDVQSRTELCWILEQHDPMVIDFLRDSNQVELFISLDPVGHRLRIENQIKVFGDDIISSSGSGICFFIKMDTSGPLSRPDQFEKAVYHGCLQIASPSSIDRQLRDVAMQFEQQTTSSYANYLKEFIHLMASHFLTLRLRLVESRSLDSAVLLKPTLIGTGPTLTDQDSLHCNDPEDDDEEDRIELLERTVHQWINIITYSLDLRDYYASIRKSGRVATIQDEIDTNILKYQVFKKLNSKLECDGYQRVLTALKQYGSILGDELEELLHVLKEEAQKAKVSVKYLGCIVKSLDAIEKVKIQPESKRGQKVYPLSELPTVYQEAINRVVIIVRNQPGYEHKERAAMAARLFYMVGNVAVTKISERALDVGIKQMLLKNQPEQCVDDTEKVCRRAVDRCITTYQQTVRWQQMELDHHLVLANFKALDNRLCELMEICKSLEQLGRYGEGVKEVTFSAERERDLGANLTQAQKLFVQLALALINQHQEALFNIHHPDEWIKAHRQFQNETKEIEVRLVHGFEEAIGRCTTIPSIYEVVVSFQHLYRRPLFTSVINSTANRMFKQVCKEVKLVCANSTGEPWITPVASILTTQSSRVAVSAQRARGYVDKIAKYVRQIGWAGSRVYRDKALTRCQLAHRLLGESIKREYNEWTDKLQMEQAYNVNAAMLKFAARRHFQRAEWIQSKLQRLPAAQP